MIANQNAELSKVTTAGTVIGTGLISSARLDKRTFLSALLGAAFGFGLSITLYGLWNGLILSLKRRKQDEQLHHMTEQLTSVKEELLELRNEIYTFSRKALNSKNDVETLPFFMFDDVDNIDDDYENFLDVENDDNDLTSTSFYSAKSPNEVLSSADSFQSVSSHLSNDNWCMTVRVPSSVLEEIDTLANYALGECPSSALPTHPSGEDISPGIQAYARCLVYKYKYRYCPEFLWRFARATYIASEESLSEEEIAQKTTNMEKNNSTSDSLRNLHSLNDIAYELQSRRQFIESGIKSAPPIYKWSAVLIGIYSSYLSAQQRIQYGYEFKELIDTAIKLDPSDALSYYLLGRWCYEVYNLSWIERQIASRLFAKPPTSTIEEAETAFENAEKLRPNHYAALYLYRAKCSICTSDYKTALYNLEKARALFGQDRYPMPHTDTGSIREQVDQLYNKYCGYA
ncbi:unnamed protein product [Heterobilharzia americana]|nr:unnamed protein product [Heterobilharzia americana]